MSAIPHGNVESDTREETTFSETESHTRNEETGIVGNETHESHDNTPGNLEKLGTRRESLGMSARTMMTANHREGRVFFIIMLLGISAATYHGKKTAKAVLYCKLLGSIPKSLSRFARRALPMFVRSKKESLLWSIQEARGICREAIQVEQSEERNQVPV